MPCGGTWRRGQEDSVKEFDFMRCPKCGPIVEGMYHGPIMFKGTISVYHRTKPNVPIANYVKCGNSHCNYMQDMWLIPGVEIDGKREVSPAAKLGIELSTIKDCYKKMPMDCYTLAELKAGRVKGASEPEINYDPNKYLVGQESVKEEKLF